MKKLLSILTLLVVAVTGAWAQTTNPGTYSTQVISADGKTSTWTFITPSSQVNAVDGKKDNDIIYHPSASGKMKFTSSNQFSWSGQSSGYIYVPAGASGTISMTVKSSSDSRYLQLYVDGVAASDAYRLYSKVNAGGITSDGKKGPQSFSFTSSQLTTVGDSTYLHFKDNNTEMKISTFTVTLTTGSYLPKTITSQEYAGVKKGTSTLTEGTDFTKAENVITLATSYKTTTAPTDIKLINHRTYDDSSSDDVNVDVAFGATASEGYFVGTATIALTTYTVKVPYDNTPSLVADKANITVTSAKIATGTAKIHLSGVNLAGTNVTLAFASTVAGLSIDKTSVAIAGGAVDTDVTVSYQSNVDVAEANVNLTISTTGVSDIVIPVTYSSTEAVTTIADVTKDTTWDFANAGTADIESPDGNNNVPFANADGFESGFEYDKLSGKGQYFYYKDNKCYQGSQLKFRTTVSGNIVVEFSNTGSSSRPYRYLSVNGVVTDKKSKNTDKVTTAAIPVPVGDVNIVGIMGTTSGDDCEPTATENMLRIYKVTFTPSANITDAEWATTVTPDYAVDFAGGVKAYIVESVGEAISLKEIEDAPANTPIIVNASKGSYTMTKKATATSDVNDNKLEAATGAEIGNGAGNFYVLGMTSTGVGFGKLADGVTLAKGKAFIPGSAWTSSKDFLPFVIGDEENETTSINSIENGESRIENYDYFNLSGQRVGKDYKGIVIVNGKKFVRK